MGITQDWKSLNVWDFRDELWIGNKRDFPANLTLKKMVNTDFIYASFLPEEQDDPRERALDSQGRKKKRRPFLKSTKTNIPQQAERIAIDWVKQKRDELNHNVVTVDDHFCHSLNHYWKIYLPRFVEDRRGRSSHAKLVRDEKNKWFSPTFGLHKEEFAHKNLKMITALDLHNYFQKLSIGSQKDIKTLIKKLWDIAQLENPEMLHGYQFPAFPKIKNKQKKQVKHFERDDWDTLMNCINELSGGAARRYMNVEEYSNLEWFKHKKSNRINWVDLFDALWVQYFWFLRSQDGQRLKIEWFKEDQKNNEFTLLHQDPKSDRKIEETKNLRTDAYEFMIRLRHRRLDEGWLLFPFTKRSSEGGAENKVMRDMNDLLHIAIRQCLPKFPILEANLTTVRHTTWRHHLEDDPTLGQYPDIVAFAKNGLTSVEMLQETYIDYISRETSLRKSKKKMRKSNYSLTRRVSDFL